MNYTLGLDYGTQSGRAILVEVATGNIVAQSERRPRWKQIYADRFKEREVPSRMKRIILSAASVTKPGWLMAVFTSIG